MCCLERLGLNKEFFEHAKRTACIDHHISNGGYADYNYILPNASSACEVLYDLLDVSLFDKSIAESMYTGIAMIQECLDSRAQLLKQ